MARTRWFLNHPIQTRYLRIVVVAMAAPALVIGMCLYLLVFRLLAQQMAFPEAIASNLIPVVHRVNWVLVFTLPALGFGIFWWAVVISHRLAGPVERLESELDRILTGDRGHRIQMREGDDLRGVADRINRLLDAGR